MSGGDRPGSAGQHPGDEEAAPATGPSRDATRAPKGGYGERTQPDHDADLLRDDAANLERHSRQASDHEGVSGPATQSATAGADGDGPGSDRR